MSFDGLNLQKYHGIGFQRNVIIKLSAGNGHFHGFLFQESTLFVIGTGGQIAVEQTAGFVGCQIAGQLGTVGRPVEVRFFDAGGFTVCSPSFA